MGKFFSWDIACTIENFLRDDDWCFSFDEDRGIFRFGLTMKGKMKELDFLIDVKKDEFLTYAIAPLNADIEDPQMMARMAEFITRANYGLKNGCFEMDFDDGELRYRSYVDCDQQIPSAAIIKNSIYTAAAMFKRYGPGMLEIIFMDTVAKEAIDKCEGDHGNIPRPAPCGGAYGDQDDEVNVMFSRLSARLGS